MKQVKTSELIAWAREHCPEPVAPRRSSFEAAKREYDAVDERIGDEAEHDPDLAKILWMETTIRLARLGWTVDEFEDHRWPVRNAKNIRDLLRDM